MHLSANRRRLALAGILAAGSLAAAAPAHAEPVPGDCGVRLERLETQFYEMADRRGYDAASDWWQARWHAYFQSCVLS
jgi:hypothetical protein